MSHEELALDITQSRIEQSIATPVDPRDRMLVERVYGIPTCTQLEIERYFDSCNRVQEIPARLFWDLAPENSKLFYSSHVYPVDGPPCLWVR